MRLLAGEAEPRLLIDAASRDENALRPERHLAVARAPREAHALFDEPSTDAEAARLGLDQEQPQLRGGARLLHEKNRADIDAVALGDPAMLALGVIAPKKLGRDLCHERLEALVPAVL